MERGEKLKWSNSGENEVAAGISPTVNRNKSSGAICKQNHKVILDPNCTVCCVKKIVTAGIMRRNIEKISLIDFFLNYCLILNSNLYQSPT